MTPNPTDTHQKALRVNLDGTNYGTFAEIGAGQEVARWFFRVGGASGTIAKTISAYDMVISDAIYGHSERYVSRQRLTTMLDHEYQLMIERLNAKRGATTKFFVFANTVAASSFRGGNEGPGVDGDAVPADAAVRAVADHHPRPDARQRERAAAGSARDGRREPRARRALF